MKSLVGNACPSDATARALVLTVVLTGVMIAVVSAVTLWPRPHAAQAFGVAQVSTGGAHTCIIGPGLGVKCWGSNFNGELGNGAVSFSPNATPVDVSGLSSHTDAVSAGRDHTCALTSAGGVKCWGANYNGQLGNGTTAASYTPVNVSGLSSGVVAISAGTWHTCALTSAGGVKCWGYNVIGQLGNGTTTVTGCYCIPTPVNVTGLGSGVASVSAGEIHTCALTTSGGLSCWGDNNRGELGDGTTSDSNVPVGVLGLGSGVAAISAATAFTCALTTSGAAQCWGANDVGQLGNGSTTLGGCQCITTAANVSGLASSVTVISTGTYGNHTCAVASGVVKCWGANDFGQLGNGTTTVTGCLCIPSPVNVSGLSSDVTALSAGAFHSCALLALSATAKCWGGNSSGQLGDGTTSDSNVPVNVVAAAKDSPPVPPCPTPYAGGCVTHTVNASLTISVPVLSFTPLSCTVIGVISIALGAVGNFDFDLLEDVPFDLHALSGHIDCPGPIGTGSSLPSGGLVEELTNTSSGNLDFPASGTFSICIRIYTTLLGILENCPDSLPTPMKDPLVLTCAFPTSLNAASCTVTGTSKFFNSQGTDTATVTEGTVSLVPGGASPATPTSTPAPATPVPLGGSGAYPDIGGSSGGSNGALVIALAAGAALAASALAGAAWYARRRLR